MSARSNLKLAVFFLISILLLIVARQLYLDNTKIIDNVIVLLVVIFIAAIGNYAVGKKTK